MSSQRERSLSQLQLNHGNYDRWIIPSPAAGADISYAWPYEWPFDIYLITATLVTSSHVSNRVVNFTIQDEQANPLFQTKNSPNQTASHTVAYNGVINYPLNIDTAASSAPVPGINFALPQLQRLQNHWSFLSTTAAIDTADQWSNVILYGRSYRYGYE